MSKVSENRMKKDCQQLFSALFSCVLRKWTILLPLLLAYSAQKSASVKQMRSPLCDAPGNNLKALKKSALSLWPLFHCKIIYLFNFFLYLRVAMQQFAAQTAEALSQFRVQISNSPNFKSEFMFFFRISAKFDSTLFMACCGSVLSVWSERTKWTAKWTAATLRLWKALRASLSL